MVGTANQVGQSAKNLAQQIAKQMAREPLEILKDAKEQTAGDSLNASEKPRENQADDQKKIIGEQGQITDQLKSGRRMEALNRELEDIRKQKIFSELQRRISAGEEIALEEYPELSTEQKQVLNAQMEAYQNQKLNSEKQNENVGVPGIHSKPSRRFGAGQKQEAEKLQTRVEKPVPPSG